MEQNLKQNWREMRLNSPSDPAELSEIINNRRLTALQRLARRYRRFSTMAFVFSVCMPTMMFNRFYEGDVRIALTCYATLCFLLCGFIDFRLYRGVSSIDCATMPVAEVLRRAVLYRKRHLQSIVLLFPLAILLIGGMIYFNGIDDRYFIIGLFCGAAVGIAIGLRELLAFLSDYKEITD